MDKEQSGGKRHTGSTLNVSSLVKPVLYPNVDINSNNMIDRLSGVKQETCHS